MYQDQTLLLSDDERRRLNEVILDQLLYGKNPEGRAPYTPEEVFNRYTGKGGLHGLAYKDYSSRHAYAAAKREYEQGQFFTPHWVCRSIVETIRPHPSDKVADLTCGMGNFANWLPDQKNFYGCDIDPDAVAVAKFLYPDADIEEQDIRWMTRLRPEYDLILLNPPYALRFEVYDPVERAYMTEASEFVCVKKAADLLKPAGYLVLIVPETFLEDEYSNRTKLDIVNDAFRFLCQYRLPKDAFAGVGVETFPTKVMLFQRRGAALSEKPYTPGVFVEPASVFPDHLAAAYAEKSKIKYLVGKDLWARSAEDRRFQDKVTKLLFDIKRHRKTAEYYPKAAALVKEYQTQKRPTGMTDAEWEKVRLTPNKVLYRLKKAVAYQSRIERDEIRLVKTSYGLKLKAYSAKSKAALGKLKVEKRASFNDMLVQKAYPFNDKAYYRLFLRKQREYERQAESFKTMGPDPILAQWLAEFRLYDKALYRAPRPASDTDTATLTTTPAPVAYQPPPAQREKPFQLSLFSSPALYAQAPQPGELILTDIQQEDLGKVLRKRYALLAWEMGCGKSIAAIAWLKYLYAKERLNYSFIVGPAVAIKLTWVKLMRKYGLDHIQIQSEKDLERIRPGQFVLLPLSIIGRLERRLLHFFKLQVKRSRTALVLDESDECANYRSGRTVSTLRLFKRLGYKLLTTGTPTRNNVNEIYPQLELLYNNSINLLCECDTIYKLDRETKEIAPHPNDHYYLKPFPPFRGQTLFNRCFNPEKTSVFGVKKKSQDILQVEELIRLLDKSRITRTFEEVVGEKKYKVFTHKVWQSEPERELYRIIMEEFVRMMKYFKQSEDSRKESLLKIIRQILLLIKAGSIPHVMQEYSCTQEPEKAKKILELVGSWPNEKVAVGTIFKEAAAYYARKLREAFPDRELFVIEGSVEFGKRSKIIEEFQATPNGILVSTQESLKSSVNIPTCNRCILECLNWNLSKMSQYYFRFIRFDSKDPKEVHMVVYEDTIEMNILALLLAKEKMNEFVKTSSTVSNEELFGEYDIDSSILDSILEKATNEDGESYLRWGRQKAA
ncbi:MAG TPA: methyltransferase [bacterium]|nr:methyltransferase [bacterium]